MNHGADERQIDLENNRRTSFLEGLVHDLWLAGRRILRRPGFALLVVITLAVGIGPNVAIFSVIKAMVLEPLPYPESDRLVQVWTTGFESRWQQPFSYPNFLDFRDASSCFDAFGAISPRSYNIGDGEPVRVEGFMATAGALHTYGVEPRLGRFFTRAEVDDGSRVVILSDQLWRERYNADPDIIGTTATISGEAHVVVGVMPAGIEFLSPWTRGRRRQAVDAAGSSGVLRRRRGQGSKLAACHRAAQGGCGVEGGRGRAEEHRRRSGAAASREQRSHHGLDQPVPATDHRSACPGR